MYRLFAEYEQFKIKNFTQSDFDYNNTCSFECNGKQYHGVGKRTPLFVFLGQYKWTIYDADDKFMFSFGTAGPHERLNKNFLTKHIRRITRERDGD